MPDYSLYVLISGLTIMSPGPGVLCTLTNSVRIGLRRSFPGIAGLALGSLVIATLTATGLGVLLVRSAWAFNLVKFAGAGYLVYVGVGLWRKSSTPVVDLNSVNHATGSLFLHGALIQILNPKAILFFMSIFPQFIDYGDSIVPRFTLLIGTYSLLILVIHSLYAVVAGSARRMLATPSGDRLARRAAGSSYVLFGVGLATTSR